MKNVYDVNLIVGSVKNDHCVKVSMPTTDNDLKKRLKIISAKKKSDYKILYSDCNDLYIEKDTDIFKLNEQLNTLKGLGKSMNEILAVKEAFESWDTCNCLDDVIKIITTRNYEFYDYNNGFKEFKKIYQDELLEHLESVDIVEHLSDYFDTFDFLSKFDEQEQLSVFCEDELTDALYSSYTTETGIIVMND